MDKTEYENFKKKVEENLTNYLTDFQQIEKGFNESLIKKIKYFKNVQSVVFENIKGKYVDYLTGKQKIEDEGSSASLEYYKGEQIYYEIKHLLEIMDELMKLRKKEIENFIELKNSLLLEIKARTEPEEEIEDSEGIDKEDRVLSCFVESPETRLIVAEITKKTGLLPAQIQRELNKLVKKEIIKECEEKISTEGREARAYILTEKIKNTLNNKDE